MIREELVASAVSFLKDPSVASSPIEKRIAFLQSKNLTREEVAAALGRTGENPSAISTAQSPVPSLQTQQQPYGFQGTQGYWPQQYPPAPPQRDWRDWFIMAMLMGGVSYGITFMAKRYIYPLISPPTPPQLQQDKQSIDESFTKAFALLEQLATDTEALKASEKARTERLDTALEEITAVVDELKLSSKRREDESRRASDEIRAIRDLIPKALEAQREGTEKRLKELNLELRGLKTLLGNKLAKQTAPATAGLTGYGVNGTSSSSPIPKPLNGISSDGGSANGTSETPQNEALSSNSTPPARKDPTFAGFPSLSGSKASIPSWQMAANYTPSSPDVSETST
ncbi:MAG: peroxisomal membrane protein pex14 [Trizodia sp. TS-e1964]|nr:MAG: peroxisomal membrane protein pex14 [Trizodia sp. TS-e1964]